MTKLELGQAMLERACRGNVEAMDFLANYWNRYVHEIDDLVDGDRTGPEALLATFALAVAVYAHPFYVKNLGALKPVVLLINSTYADAVGWEKSPEKWQRDWADHHRHCGMDMVVAVAQLCGGYELGRAVAREQREICWAEHHRLGKVV